MLVDPGLDLGEPLVLLADVVLLGEVDEVGDGFGGEELEGVDDVDLLVIPVALADVLAFI